MGNTGDTVNLGDLVSAKREYVTKPREISPGLYAYEIVTVVARQWLGPDPTHDGVVEVLEPLPSGLAWVMPGGER